MLNTMIETLTTTGGGDITNMEVIMAMLTAVGLGMLIALTYLTTNRDSYGRRSFSMTLIMLPVILAVIILFVGSNVARAFSLAGILSIIRFRSAPGDAKDIGYIFFSTAVGIGCGVGMYAGSAIFVVFMALVMLILEKVIFSEKTCIKNVKITIPEDLSFENAFEDVFEKYTKKHKLLKLKTTDLGSLYEAQYQIVMNEGVREKEFIDELRVRNGNLNIVMTVHATE